MATVAVFLLLLCLKSPFVKATGVELILNGVSIPTDGSGRVLITDINTNGESNHEALVCQTKLSSEISSYSYWSLNNVTIGTAVDTQGWKIDDFQSGETVLVRLIRISDAAKEGVFTCHIDEKSIALGVYYPINSTLATFVLVDRREKISRVQCNSTGGRALSMIVTGPDGFNSDLNNIQPVRDPHRIGDDEFSASTDVISGGRDGDIYQCIASNGVSSDSNSSMELRVASAPNITSLEQISATAVRVEWSQPSEGATVTGYVVHYSDGDTNRTESIAASSTSSDITHLTSGLTYTISVEATSQHLSGESDERTVILEPPPEAPGDFAVSDVKSSSVRVSWQTVEDADRYIVTLSQTMGDDQLGLCPEDSHAVSVNTSNLSLVVGQTEDDMLKVYTTYSITVAAESDRQGSSQNSDLVTFTTTQKSASVSPRNVAATIVSSTDISVQWDGLTPCSQVNGLIVEYRVQYTAESSVVVQSINVAGEWNVMRAQTSLTGLIPYTNYSIQVAAINEQGDVGLYSDFIMTMTLEDIPGPVVIILDPSFFKITITWGEPTMPNGVIIAYEVSYGATYYSQPFNTTNLATSFTTQSDLEVGTEYIFNVTAYTSVGSGATTTASIPTLSRPPALQGVKVTSVNATAAKISWTVLMIDVPVDNYTVVYSSNDVEKTVVFPAPATSGVITALNPANTYQFRVFATVTINGIVIDGEQSTPINFTYTGVYNDMKNNVQTFVWILGGAVAAGVVALGCGMVIIVYCLKKCCRCKHKSPQRPSLEATNLPLTSVSCEKNTSEPMDRHVLEAVNRADRVEKKVNLCVKQPLHVGPTERVHFSPIPVEEFADYVSRCHVNVNKEFSDQFTEIDRDGNHSINFGSSRDLRKLHRFANITVYDDNRIILKPIAGYSTCQRDFINASYIDGYNFKRKFIATQGPMSETTIDFWRLVWQEGAQSVVMVTNLEEGNQKKCHQYWPDTGSQSFGPFNITITDQQILADYTTRWLSVKLMGSSKKIVNVTQFHFTAWPDHGVPDYATSLLAFHKRVKRHHKPSKGPMLVHCSAGVGRTGTLITIDCVLDQLEKEKMVDIAGIIIHLRIQRMKMVQALEQYIFIHDVILEAIACGDTQINASNLRRRVHKMCYRDPTTNLTDMENQFKTLDKISPNPREILRKRALENPARNRSDDYLPGDRWRVILRDVQDYIHAVYVNGYKQQKAFIIAQSPMQSTIRDFWKMIHDRKCGVIIMLCDLVENGQEVCHQYWPTSGTIHVREYTVDLQEEKKKEGYIVRHFSIVHKKLGKDHQVVQLHITNWSPGGHCSNFSSVINVIAEMAVIQRRTGNKPVLVHCSDTVSRSGMFCAIATTIERCKTEGVVDVFQVVKALRVQKPGAVSSVAHFHMVFEAVLVYLDTFDTYSNFRDLRK